MNRITLAVAGVAALAVAGLPAAASASVHPGATPACGHHCIDISSLELGTSQIVNAYVPGDTGVGAKVGQKVNLHFKTDTQVNEDVTGGKVGTVSQFCQSATNPQGLLSSTSYACLKYPSYPIYEADVSPFGNETGLCAGLALPEFAGEHVTLRNCGADAGSLWIGDLANAHFTSGHWYTPLVSAGFTGFSHPISLTVNAGSKKPVNQLFGEPENKLTGGYIANSQMWTGQDGPSV
jgi:hypothetical protein